MNERIREIALQSGAEFWQRLENDTVNPEAYITFDPPDSLEKFAELIVQRTLAIVEAHTEIFQSDEARAMVEHIKRSVKTDFGVEE
jgi:hypothetical protein